MQNLFTRTIYLALTMWQEPLRIGADIQPVGLSNVCSRNFRTSLEMNHHLLRKARHITASGKLFVSVHVYNVSDGAHDKLRNQRLTEQHMCRLLKPQSLILEMSNTSTSKSMSLNLVYNSIDGSKNYLIVSVCKCKCSATLTFEYIG